MKPLPVSFVERIKKQYPNDHSVFIESLERPVITSVHLHSEKGKELFSDNVGLVPWWSAGVFLKERPRFTSDPLFHAGAYYPQESSSMFIGFLAKKILSEKKNVRVLDLCAAPGGKSILLSTIIGDSGVLISNEINKMRVRILEENLIKWGSTNAIVTNNEAKDFRHFQDYFDLILVDAPCSGEGMFRKDEVAREEWSEQNVAMCSTRQRDILQYLPELLTEDGHLIYSTCTFAELENENQSSFLGSVDGLEEVSFEIPDTWKDEILIDNGYKFLPHRVKGEGFYCNVFKRKNAGSRRHKGKPFGKWYRELTKQEQQAVAHLELKHPLMNGNNEVVSCPVELEELDFLLKHLFVIAAGVKVGELIRGQLNPAHSMIAIPNVRSVYPMIELELESALLFLNRGDLKIATPTQGWALVSYQGRLLGFVKVLPNRVNNYYPKEWRIRFLES